MDSGDYINYLRVEYNRDQDFEHGSVNAAGLDAMYLDDTNTESAVLSLTKTLDSVYICKQDAGTSSMRVSYLEFNFSDGTFMSGGTEAGDCTTLQSNDGSPIQGFRGRADHTGLHALGIIWWKPK